MFPKWKMLNVSTCSKKLQVQQFQKMKMLILYTNHFPGIRKMGPFC